MTGRKSSIMFRKSADRIFFLNRHAKIYTLHGDPGHHRYMAHRLVLDCMRMPVAEQYAALGEMYIIHCEYNAQPTPHHSRRGGARILPR